MGSNVSKKIVPSEAIFFCVGCNGRRSAYWIMGSLSEASDTRFPVID